jgi:hypothetical protein
MSTGGWYLYTISVKIKCSRGYLEERSTFTESCNEKVRRYLAEVREMIDLTSTSEFVPDERKKDNSTDNSQVNFDCSYCRQHQQLLLQEEEIVNRE